MSDALLCQANFQRFPPGRSLEHGPVRSLMQLWGRAGSGTVVVDGRTFAVEPGTVLLMPWDHRVAYRAGRSGEWHFAGVHCLPRCRPPAGVAPPFWQVPHGPEHPLAAATWLADADPPLLREPRSWQLPADHPAVLLGDYVVGRFCAGRHAEADMRRCADLILAEWRQLLAHAAPVGLPDPLRRVEDYAASGPERLPDLPACARVAGVSRATLERLARTHWGEGVHAHLRRRQLERARARLRATAEPIAAVAAACGFADPLYFSRVFRRATGLAPRAWRARYGRL